MPQTTPELLIAIAIFSFLSFVPAGAALILTQGPVRTLGLTGIFGNRADPPALPAWGDRALRANRNQLDNVGVFALIVVAAQMAGVEPSAIAGDATLFLGARVAHLAVYVAGIPYLRTVAFVVSARASVGIIQQIWAAAA